VGNLRTAKRIGGGVTFAKSARDFSQRMPKKQRRLAKDSAILVKLLGEDMIVVDELKFDVPRTREFVKVLGNLKIDRGCLVATSGIDMNLYKSARNVPKVAVMPLAELNAADICRHRKMLFTKEAFLLLLENNRAQGN